MHRVSWFPPHPSANPRFRIPEEDGRGYFPLISNRSLASTQTLKCGEIREPSLGSAPFLHFELTQSVIPEKIPILFRCFVIGWSHTRPRHPTATQAAVVPEVRIKRTKLVISCMEDGFQFQPSRIFLKWLPWFLQSLCSGKKSIPLAPVEAANTASPFFFSKQWTRRFNKVQ